MRKYVDPNPDGPERQGARIKKYMQMGGGKGRKNGTWLAGILGLDPSTVTRKLSDTVRHDGKRAASSGWTRQEVEKTAEALGVPFEEIYIPKLEGNKERTQNRKPVRFRNLLKDDKLLQYFFRVRMDSQTRDHVVGLLIEIEQYLVDNRKAIFKRLARERVNARKRLVVMYCIRKIARRHHTPIADIIKMRKIRGNYGTFQEEFAALWLENWFDTAKQGAIVMEEQQRRSMRRRKKRESTVI